jgi:hypothetical protein
MRNLTLDGSSRACEILATKYIKMVNYYQSYLMSIISNLRCDYHADILISKIQCHQSADRIPCHP